MSLPKPIADLLSPIFSAIVGAIWVSIAQYAGFLHISREQVLAGLLFLVGALVHAARAHRWDRFLVGRVRQLEGVARPLVGNVGSDAITKELVALVGKVDALIGLHAAASTGNANSAAAVTRTSVTAGSTQTATSTPTSTPAATT